MKKLIIILGFVLVFSGCTVDYNITIKNSGAAIEKMSVDVEKKNQSTSYEKVKKDIENEYDQTLKKYRYGYNISNENNIIKFKLSKMNYLNNIADNSLYQALYEKAELFESNNIVNFRSIGNNYIGDLFVTKNYEENISFNKNVDALRINIQFENKILSHNADKYDKKTNTCTWIFTPDDYNKSIQFSYDKSVTVLKSNKIKSEKNDKFKKLKRILIIVFGLIFIGLSMVGVVITSSKKVNKI